MLSAAKYLDAQRDRPFAAAQGDTVRHLRLMLVEGLLGHPWVGCAASSSRSQQGTGPRPIPGG